VNPSTAQTGRGRTTAERVCQLVPAEAGCGDRGPGRRARRAEAAAMEAEDLRPVWETVGDVGDVGDLSCVASRGAVAGSRWDVVRWAPRCGRLRAITPDGPFEEQDVECSTPESLIASDEVEVVRDSGALKEVASSADASRYAASNGGSADSLAKARQRWCRARAFERGYSERSCGPLDAHHAERAAARRR
jgi:hypothetical protein